MNAAKIPEEAASDIQNILGDKFDDFELAKMGDESEFSSGSFYRYEGPNDARWQYEWKEFERSLKTVARFFDQSALSLLGSVFDGIDKMRTQDGRSIVVSAGPGTNIPAVFRARCFQSVDTLKLALARPDKLVGSPPSNKASAGRLNAYGISVFYGANDPRVALAEVRPPVGSKVVVARFEIIRPVQLLDLTAICDVEMSGSIFDPTFIDRIERTTFLRGLSDRITMPVMPEHEALEYVVTQAIADFLATESNPRVDGIVFPSVQAPGKARNICFFHKAARLERIELPEGTKVSAHLDRLSDDDWDVEFSDWDVEYSVYEQVPPENEAPEGRGTQAFSQFLDFETDWVPRDSDGRAETLKIDLDSVRVHHVNAVRFETKEHSVHRSRWEMPVFEEDPF